MVSIDVLFDDAISNVQRVYYSGQRISGIVLISLSKPKKTKGVYVEILGFSSCHWTEHAPRKRHRTRIINYDGRENYFNSRTYLAGNVEGNIIDLNPGNLRYTFACELPANIPSSIYGELGRICYTIRVVIDHPWGEDMNFTVPITVIRPFDLNIINELRAPCQSHITKRFSYFLCFPCKSNPLNITITIPKTGYVPGEKIIIRSQMDNASNLNVDSMEYELQQMAVFNSQTPCSKTRSKTKEIHRIQCPGIKKYQRGDYEQSLLIPNVLATTTDAPHSRIIQIYYFLVVRPTILGLGTGNDNLSFSQPITIGTVPIQP